MKHGDIINAVKLVKSPALCPFCNTEGAMIRTEWRTSAKRKTLWHYYECWQCGARGGEAEYPEGALLAWNGRPSRSWMPLASDGMSYLLPGGQKYSHLLIHENGRVSFLDYIEPEVSAEGDGIAAQVDVDLGAFRISSLREVKKYDLPAVDVGAEGDDERGGNREEGTQAT